jgi:hypothetical protein
MTIIYYLSLDSPSKQNLFLQFKIINLTENSELNDGELFQKKYLCAKSLKILFYFALKL